jgi:tricorn protease
MYIRSILLSGLAGLSFIANAQSTDPLWLRNAAISPDGRTIAFCYQGDIWRVSSAGGEAMPLTTNEGLDYAPLWQCRCVHHARHWRKSHAPYIRFER